MAHLTVTQRRYDFSQGLEKAQVVYGLTRVQPWYGPDARLDETYAERGALLMNQFLSSDQPLELHLPSDTTENDDCFVYSGYKSVIIFSSVGR